MEWLLAVSEEIDIVAIPPDTAAVPNDVTPSKNSTVPVTVAGTTVAVNVTDAPKQEGFKPELTETLEVACATMKELLVAELNPGAVSEIVFVPAMEANKLEKET